MGEVFCALMEDCEALIPIAFIKESAAILSRFYEAGLALPDVSVIRGAKVKDHVSPEQASEVSRRVHDKFG